MTRPMIIAIDGPAASGKGTLGKRLAAFYGLEHLDTGLLYRAVARLMLDKSRPLEDEGAAQAAAVALNLAYIDESRLRGREMGDAASIVSAYPSVRQALLEQQRLFAANAGASAGGAVLDGRDIGTVVCPDAPVKLFVTATPEERARRRHSELVQRGESVSYADVLADIICRDERDMTRTSAPLRPADDAHVVDTSALDAQAAFEAARAIVDRTRNLK
jgi:CMP/dCMP kinase